MTGPQASLFDAEAAADPALAPAGRYPNPGPMNPPGMPRTPQKLHRPAPTGQCWCDQRPSGEDWFTTLRRTPTEAT